LVLLLETLGVSQVAAQVADAKVIAPADYVLSKEMAAAGLIGKMHFGLTIETDGSAKGFRFYGGPSWPCGTDIKNDDLEKVQRSVEDHLKQTRFEPEMKNGKPRSTDGQIVFKLTNPAHRSDEYVDVVTIKKSMVEFVPRNLTSSGPGLSLIEVFVDETGKVISAGLSKGPRTTVKAARDRGCNSRFKPLIRDGKAVRFTGVLLTKS
jgi:hypothetical protein